MNHVLSMLVCRFARDQISWCSWKVYQPIRGTFWEKLAWSIEKANDISSNMIVRGDLNVNFFNLSSTHEIHIIMNAYNITNTINAPTRITHNTCTLIDPILVSKNIQTYDSGTISHTLSDHTLLLYTFIIIPFQMFHTKEKFGITKRQILSS